MVYGGVPPYAAAVNVKDCPTNMLVDPEVVTISVGRNKVEVQIEVSRPVTFSTNILTA
jgi:hypothetical protein